MKHIFYLAAIFLLLLSGCRRDNRNDIAKRTIDFSFPSGTLFTGDIITFSTAVPAADRPHWFFGNIYYSNYPYPGSSNYAVDSENAYTNAPSSGADSCTGPVFNHIMYTPGSYNVVLTANGDKSTACRKTLTFASPEILNEGMLRTRLWKRFVRSGVYPYDTSYALPDTTFALVVANHNCKTPGREFPFRCEVSSSSNLIYKNNTDTRHYYGDYGYVAYKRLVDSVYVIELTHDLIGNIDYSITYTSTH